MYTTYHLASAQEVNSDLLDAIKATFKSKAIKIIVEEDVEEFEFSEEMRIVLEERVQEDEKTYISGEESIQLLHKKYGL